MIVLSKIYEKDFEGLPQVHISVDGVAISFQIWLKFGMLKHTH